MIIAHQIEIALIIVSSNIRYIAGGLVYRLEQYFILNFKKKIKFVKIVGCITNVDVSALTVR